MNLKLQLQQTSAVKEEELVDIARVTLQSHTLSAESLNESHPPSATCTLATCPFIFCDHESYLSYPPTACDGKGSLLTRKPGTQNEVVPGVAQGKN